VPDWARSYVSLEGDAVDFKMYFGELFPGVSQRQEYAHELVSKSPAVAPADVDPIVDARMKRQAIFTRPNPPRFHIILGESALHYRVGGLSGIIAQIDRMIELARLPHVTLQVAPFSAGAHAALGNNFTILTANTAGELTEWCYTERLDGAEFTPNTKPVRLYKLVFESLMVNALGEGETLALLSTIRDNHVRAQRDNSQ